MAVPDSIVRVGNVPWPHPSGGSCHSMTFGSTQDQAAFIAGRCPRVMDDSTFIRPDSGSFRFNRPSQDLYGANYCMFANPTGDYAGKWWYAFVVDVVYVNDSVCDVIFEVDPLQTWMFDYDLTECYVEREHIQVDTPGANLLDEPVSTGELEYGRQKTVDRLKTYNIIVQTTETVDLEQAVPLPITYPQAGGWYGLMWSGCKLYGFEDSGTAAEYIKRLNGAGAGGAISSVFQWPRVLCPPIGPDHGLEQNDTSHNQYVENFTDPGTLNGYAPRNKKLLTYPFNFIRVDNNNGLHHDFRWEFFASYDATGQHFASFTIEGSIDPTSDIFISPRQYNNLTVDFTEHLNLGGIPLCAWTYNSYQNWLAQNAGSNLVSLAVSAAMLFPAGKALGASAKGISELTSVGETLKNPATVMRNAALTKAETAGAAAGAVGLANLGASVFDASMQPDKAVGKASNAALAGVGYGMFTISQICCREQFARLIDQFFDMYGYTTQEVKVPNVTGRRSWNYVKTRNANMSGSAPAREMAKINALFDAGITWWHTSDIGNYSLDNSPV